MKLTTPKLQAERKTDVNLYYVQSDYFGAVPHVVVHHNKSRQLFCDCRDFMIRQLPKLLTPEFQNCKHGQFVLDCTKLISTDSKLVSADGSGSAYNTFVSSQLVKSQKFGVFFWAGNEALRSCDISKVFDSIQDAQRAVDINQNRYGLNYFVRELE